MKSNKKRKFSVAIVIVVILIIIGAGYGARKVTNYLNMEHAIQRQAEIQKQEQEKIRAEHDRFIEQMAAPAINAYHRNYQILPSIVVAQSIVESNWGNSKLYQNANNPFGIKGQYKGQSISYDTFEYVHGKKVTVPAHFRKYTKLEEAILDHNHALRTLFINSANVTNYETAARLLQKNSYATDPNYADKLISIIKQYNLVKYDQNVLNKN